MATFGWCLDGNHKNCPKKILSIGNNGDIRSVIECNCTTCNHHTQQKED